MRTERQSGGVEVASADGPRLTYQPAFDGWRGVGVLAILCYHAEMTWARGTFLSLSGFFALSGYLITSLLLIEHQRTGRISLRSFWSRRARRLLPAAMVTLVGIVALTVAIGDAMQLRNLRADALSALGYVVNWRFIAGGQGYQDLFSNPSPVQHYWSLAVEEQFYLVLPLLAAGLLWWRRGSLRSLGVVLGALLVGSAALMWALAGEAGDRAYYGTDTRAAEFLTGALLAVLVSRLPPLSSPRARRALGIAGAVALAATAVLWLSIDLDGTNTYPWAFLGAAGLTAVVIVAAGYDGPVRRLLSFAPLRGLGLISYGIYLIHWPVFLWLTAERTGLAEAPLFALRLAVTVALALVSYYLVEQPIRTGARLVGPRALIAVPVATAVLAIGIVVATLDTGPAPLEIADTHEAIEMAAPPPTTPSTAEAPGEPEPVRLLVVGDSVSYNLADGLLGGPASDEGLSVWKRAVPGCGLGRGGYKRLSYGEGEVAEVCNQWDQYWREDLATFDPDVVLISASPWDAIDRSLPHLGDGWRSFGDPAYDDWYAGELSAATEVLTSTGATVVWLTHPHVDLDTDFPEHEPARMARMNEILHTVADRSPLATVVDLDQWIARHAGGYANRDVRHDGIHYTEPGAQMVAEWLAPQLRPVSS
ncbi:MAG: acyltransferase [Acidimicrobiia bacterium]|nr:acyltransferase [Acidimicrobiia bacterium]